MPDRTYTEEDVAAIFARAGERQRTAPTLGSSTGLTLAEIEQAGLEAGLDPSSIRVAAAELDAQQRYPNRSKIAVAERWVETPIEAGAWEDLVASLRRRFGSGTAWGGRDTASLGTAQEWTHTATSGTTTTVTLSPREERALLRVMQEDAGLEDGGRMGWLMAAFLALIPSVLAGALVAETLAFGDLAGVAAVVIVWLSGVALGGPALAAHVRNGRARQAEQVQRIADDLVEQIGRDRSTPVAPASSEHSVPRLDLPALDGSDSEVQGPSEKQRVRS